MSLHKQAGVGDAMVESLSALGEARFAPRLSKLCQVVAQTILEMVETSLLKG